MSVTSQRRVSRPAAIAGDMRTAELIRAKLYQTALADLNRMNRDATAKVIEVKK